MWSRNPGVASAACLAIALAVFTASARAKSAPIVGTIAGIETKGPQISGLQIRTAETMQSIRVDTRTQSLKWTTHAPWQQSTAADAQSLSVGRCASVDTRANDAALAKLIRISTEPAGSLWDPCRFIK